MHDEGLQAADFIAFKSVEHRRWRPSTKGPSFLVDSIRNAAKYQLPKGFESSAQRDARQQASNSRKRASRDIQQQRDARWQQEENARLEPFTAFWNGLAQIEQTEFEAAALKLTQPMKRDGYVRLREIGGLVFEQYRKVILRDHFERTLLSQSNRDHSA